MILNLGFQYNMDEVLSVIGYSFFLFPFVLARPVFGILAIYIEPLHEFEVLPNSIKAKLGQLINPQLMEFKGFGNSPQSLGYNTIF